jgi:hypothetical protein
MRNALVLLLLCTCTALVPGCGSDSDSSTSPSGASSSSLAGAWTYTQQAPSSCSLPTQHRKVTFPATITARGGSVYDMRLSGTDSDSYSYFYQSGSGYRGNVLYSKSTSDFVVFSMHEAAFTQSGNTLTSTSAGEYQYVGSTMGSCSGAFTVTLTR